MNILIPIAAEDTFFPVEEFRFPKPLIEVAGKPMIERVVENVRAIGGRMIFVVRAQDVRQHSLDSVLRLIGGPEVVTVPLRYPTQGAACSCLMAIDWIDNDEPLIICNGDQVIDGDLNAIVASMRGDAVDAGVVTFPSVHPRWSYVNSDEQGRVFEAAEKRVISRRAVAGFYYFARGRDFVRAALAMIRQGASVNDAYYIAPSLNQLVLEGMRIGEYGIAADRYHSFYSPQKIREHERAGLLPVPTADDRALTVVIPMAGAGSRFAAAGYGTPKPFIDIAGKTMIERVLDNLSLPGVRFVLMARREHLEAEAATVERLKQRYPVSFIPVEGLSEGAACTVLQAGTAIPDDGPLMIANCDQLVDFDVAAFVDDCLQRGLGGSILCFRDAARDPKWSFARTGPDGLVAEVREKVAVSDLATVGIYLFRRGRDFVTWAVDMIARNDRTNNEFYVCPVYNHAVTRRAPIGVYEIPAEAMQGLGTPEDLRIYLRRRGEAGTRP
ncbi:glycosyltransferase family 2 protein [Azospirillum doebereinerae]|uniref:Nucleotidyl transferase n=1 Tax=Azospirillum doebereinerae TaxID=92933 RepID=A0A3S0VKX6_9PROT|nr:glycosyltransferase family 2 protein [Azospirillum doebereinerae]RUQ75202.1 nucleotidyl transferase [Azospirillum doebereinerae]